MSTGIIILAAGASTRLGKPKQLLPWQGGTLLQHAVQVAQQVCPKPVMVLGAHLHLLEEVLGDGAVQVVHNPNWQEGIASSIRVGLAAAMQQTPAPSQVLFIVCDQPYISAALLQELVLAQQKTGKGIIACAYAGTLGIPALFDQVFFPQLLDLEGDTGAKKIIQQHSDEVFPVAFPMGDIDIDTAEQYDALRRK